MGYKTPKQHRIDSLPIVGFTRIGIVVGKVWACESYTRI